MGQKKETTKTTETTEWVDLVESQEGNKQMSETTYIKFYLEWGEFFDELTTEEIGRLTVAMLDLARYGEDTTFEDRALRVVWKSIRGAMERTMSSQLNRAEINRENGQKGGAPKGNQNASKQPKQPNQPKTSETSHTNTNTNTNTNADADYVLPHEAASAPQPEMDFYSRVTETWNAQNCTKNILNIKPLTKRENQLRLCLMETDQETFLETIKAIDHMAWFQKRIKEANPVTFDWFVDPNNFRKVLEGNYTQERGNKDKEGMVWL